MIMKKLKPLFVIIAVLSISSIGYAQGNSLKYFHAGYTRISFDDFCLDGASVGFAKLNPFASKNFYWGYDLELGYNKDKSTVTIHDYENQNADINTVKSTALSVKFSLDLFYKVNVTESVAVFPYAGAAFRPFIGGETEQEEVILKWFDNNNGKRFQVGVEVGAKVFINRLVLGAEYQKYLTKLNQDHFSVLSLSAGWLF